jgi:hypothetical protein
MTIPTMKRMPNKREELITSLGNELADLVQKYDIGQQDAVLAVELTLCDLICDAAKGDRQRLRDHMNAFIDRLTEFEEQRI